MADSLRKIQADFDRIALLHTHTWDHNTHYHSFLLKQLPPQSANALEIGCGTGSFSRLLATHADRVLALDLSPNMIEIAKQRSHSYPNIDYQVADALSVELPSEHFDCIVSIATCHHLPMNRMLSKMKEALKPNGTLIILDLFQSEGLLDAVTSALAIPVNITLRLIKTGRLRACREVREVWAEHGRSDTYLRMSEIREVCGNILPGAEVRKHLLWRYSIRWKKIGATH